MRCGWRVIKPWTMEAKIEYSTAIYKENLKLFPQTRPHFPKKKTDVYTFEANGWTNEIAMKFQSACSWQCQKPTLIGCNNVPTRRQLYRWKTSESVRMDVITARTFGCFKLDPKWNCASEKRQRVQNCRKMGRQAKSILVKFMVQGKNTNLSLKNVEWIDAVHISSWRLYLQMNLETKHVYISKSKI
jgi:hypothetical protein